MKVQVNIDPKASFEDSQFLVTWVSDGACSVLIDGWEAVKRHVLSELEVEGEYVEGCVASLEDEDHWYCDGYGVRLKFDYGEFDYCVGLCIIRVTHCEAMLQGGTDGE